jgi:hypothetical protein
VSFDELFNATFWNVLAVPGTSVRQVMEARGVGRTIDRAGREEGVRNRKMKLLMTGPALQILQSCSSFKVQPRYSMAAGGCGRAGHSDGIPKAPKRIGT